MPCHAMHPIQDLFLESFSYVLQFDMHFYMHSYVDKNLILVRSGCYMGINERLPTRTTGDVWFGTIHESNVESV
jgi:hypothetical protein